MLPGLQMQPRPFRFSDASDLRQPCVLSNAEALDQERETRADLEDPKIWEDFV